MNKMNKEKEDIGKMRGFSRITAVVIIIIAIVSILVFLILFRINFMVGEQLRITISPEYSEVQTTSPGTIPFEVDVKLYNKYVCDAICDYTLTDMSYNTLLDNGTFNSKAYKSKLYSFNIPIDYYGSGTNTYLYRLECKNIQTTLCPANDDLLVRKSLLVVRYVPSAEQLAAKAFLEKNYVTISENMVNASKLIDSEGTIIDSLNKSNIVLNTSQYYALKSDRDVLLESVDGLMSLWKNNDFIDTKAYMVDIKLVDRTTTLLSKTVQYDDYLISSTQEYNSLLTELVSLHSVLQEYKQILSLNIFSIDASTKQSMLRALVSGNSYITQFENKNYNPGLLYHDVLELEGTTAELNKLVLNSTNAELSRNLPAIYIYSKMLCADSKNDTNSTNVTKSNYNTCNFNYALTASNLIDASTKLKNTCARVALIENIVTNSDSSSNDSKEILLIQYKLLIDYESMIIGAGNSASNPVLTYYSTYLRDSLKTLYNITDPEALINNITLDSDSELTFNKKNLIFADIKDINELCTNDNSIPALVPLTVNYLPIPVINTSAVTPISMVAHPEIMPECCLYGKCQSCEFKSKNPLILLHGHSFNKDVNAYQSVETFNSFEHAFKEDKLYLPTGLLVKNENSTAGILGHFSVPILSKPTYYLETYNSLLGLTVSESKTGNIDTYALRLKETIEYTMYVSGSDKVDIVAHSMGGLVVRRYIQIFGAQNLGTVILIGTPNNGISEKTYTLCKIFGAINECEDMRASGIFIKKLNDYSNQPDVKNLYLVVGRGCDTDGEDGDGVVPVNNSLIKNFPDSRVLYVDGKCSGTTLLHGDMLNVNTHPEVYAFIKEKLK